MTHLEIREKFLKFFQDRGHKIVPSSSLLPDDPSVLFTTAGMQQFKKYYTGEADPMRDFGTKNTASIQKSMRTSDIDEVGDESHLTFFEMLGNFSFGGYFKREAIQYGYEFIAQEMGLQIDFVSVYEEDTESEKIWQEIAPELEIKKMGKSDNWWGPTGDQGPCGPTTEIYVNGVEIWNIVFNEYYQSPRLNLTESQDLTSGELTPLATPGIDTGMGLERLAMVVQNKKNIFETDLFPELSGGTAQSRVIADHSRAIAFLICDGVLPSNKEQGYVLRRLMRRIVAKGEVDFNKIFSGVVKDYGEIYKNLNNDLISAEFNKEKEKFSKTLAAGLRELKKTVHLDALTAFKLYESYGLPFEVMKDVVPSLSRADFDEEFKKHQQKSREGSIKKFGGHGLLLDTSELKAANEEELKKVTRLHTATHMLQAALRKVLGDEVRQAGSDITAERLRFDFTFNRKMTPEEVKKTEDLVNEATARDLQVSYEELPIEKAKKTGALYFFKEKYPEKVKVYRIGPAPSDAGQSKMEKPFSIEFCGGPHVSHTAEIGKFKIIKEEAVSTGVRRIRATVL